MPFDAIFCQDSPNAICIFPIIQSALEDTVRQLDPLAQRWIKLNQFKAKSGEVCLLPDQTGALTCVLVGMGDEQDYWAMGAAAAKLPAGDYALDCQYQPALGDAFLLYLAWGLGAYRFTRYRDNDHAQARLRLAPTMHTDKLRVLCESICWTRDLINTPAHDLRPESYAEAIKAVFKPLGTKIKVIDGKTLLKEFPLVEAVGRAGEQGPCLVDITWGSSVHKTLTLVGKGVCFDSGGLGIKPSAGMRQMKKDMGGSAIVLGLAQAIIRLNLPVQLRVIVPLVENAISGNSMRPGDVIRSRSGKTVEIGHTDAEGRLILADALAYACEAKPDYLIDFATLTGAARVALGPDIPAYFTDDETLAHQLEVDAATPLELLWRLPLYAPYHKFIESKIADIENISSTSYGGAITAALFLKAFVDPGCVWAHFDINADNTRDLPGRPQGGEAHGLLTMLNWVEQQFKEH